MSELSTLEVLVKARARIADFGRWTTGEICDLEGRVCAMGAVGAVVYGPRAQYVGQGRLEELPAVRALARAVPWVSDDYAVDGSEVWIENDAGGRNRNHHAKVLALFDRAIAAEEAKLNEAEKKKEEIPQAVPRCREDVGCMVASPSSSPGVESR